MEKKKFFANRYVFKRWHRIPELRGNPRERWLFTRVHSLEFIHENRFNILTPSLSLSLHSFFRPFDAHTIIEVVTFFLYSSHQLVRRTISFHIKTQSYTLVKMRREKEGGETFPWLKIHEAGVTIAAGIPIANWKFTMSGIFRKTGGGGRVI